MRTWTISPRPNRAVQKGSILTMFHDPRVEPHDPVRKAVQRRTQAFKDHQRETGKGRPV